MTAAHGADPAGQPGQVQLPTVAWAVKRALLGLLILVVMFGGGAWLLHASIDPEPRTALRSTASPNLGAVNNVQRVASP